MTKGILTWENPTQYTNGAPYNQATDGAGYELSFNGGEAVVSLPFALGTTFDMSVLDEFKQLRDGSHTVGLRVVTKAGQKSDYSVVSFQVALTPMAPASVAVA